MERSAVVFEFFTTMNWLPVAKSLANIGWHSDALI